MTKLTIAEYITHRLVELGCRHVFGVPGTSCADFFSAVEAHPDAAAVVTANELEAGYAADGYSRFAGLGACSVSYGVGTLSLINAVAGSLVEHVPVVVINGGPSQRELDDQAHLGVLYSHSSGRDALDLRLFREVCVAAVAVTGDEDTPRVIDDLLRSALRSFGPVYLEVPNDLWLHEVDAPDRPLDGLAGPGWSNSALLEAATTLVEAASEPTLLIGVEVVRCGLRDEVLALIEATGLPFATTVLSKSFVGEDHPQFRGTYDTDLVVKPVRELLEGSDCLIALGCVFGVDHLTLVKSRFEHMVNVAFGAARVGRTDFGRADLASFVRGFRPRLSPAVQSKSSAYPGTYRGRREGWAEMPNRAELTHEALFDVLDAFLGETQLPTTTVLDTCLGSFPGADLVMRRELSYAANPVWLSIGHGTPAANGAWFATGVRPLVVTGDGGFQMVLQSVSTMARHEIPAILVIIDNATYAIEQYLIDPCFFVRDEWPGIPFVALQPWNYERMPDLFGGGQGVKVRTATELREALARADQYEGGPFVIRALVPADDVPPENLPFAQGQCAASSSRRELPSRWALPTQGVVGDRHSGARSAPDSALVDVVRNPGEVEWGARTYLLGCEMVVVSPDTGAGRSGLARLGAHPRQPTVSHAGPLALVVQKGRSFQRHHPGVDVLVDRGRYLVIGEPDTPLEVEESCFAITSLPDDGVIFRRVEVAPSNADPAVVDAVARLDKADLLQRVSTLSEFFNRQSLMEGYAEAAELCEGWLSVTGCAVSRQRFAMPGGESFNIIGERKGSSADPRLVIIGAHLDSVNHEQPGGRAPGADDNASGTVVVTAVAEALAHLDFEHDIRFVLYGGEEQGLFGSKAYVAALSPHDRGRLIGALNLDMVASRNTDALTVLLEGHPISRAMVDELSVLAATYTRLGTQVSLKPFASDHVPYIDAELPAVLTIEGNDGAYPHEHTARDTPDRLDPELMVQIAALDLAWVATSASPKKG